MQVQTKNGPVQSSESGRVRVAGWAVVAFVAGCVPIAAGIIAGGDPGASDLATAAVLAAILALVTAVVFGITVRGRLGPDVAASRRSRTALVLSVAGLATVVAFWSGLPVVLGIAAALLGVHSRRAARSRGAAAAVVLGVLAVVAGLGSSVSDYLTVAPEPVRIVAVDYAYDVPDKVSGTTVHWQFTNDGSELHEFGLVRLEDGRTVEELIGAVEAGEQPDWAVDVAGVPVLSPQRSVTLSRRLDEPGTYAVLCFLPDPEGTPHIAHGMVDTFEVTEGDSAELPSPDAVIVATDDGLDVPQVPAGDVVLELRNDGQQAHEFWITAFADGKSDADVEAWFESGQQGPPPAEFLGGIQTIPGGSSVYERFDLDAGVTYTVADYANGFTKTFVAR